MHLELINKDKNTIILKLAKINCQLNAIINYYNTIKFYVKGGMVMKKSYKFGEILLALREEYKECKHLLEELNKCINVKSDNNEVYFTGSLPVDEKIQKLSYWKIGLCVGKRYHDILKKIQYLKYNWSSIFLYTAYFTAVKKDNGLYGLEYENELTPFGRKKYIPKVEIIDQSKFSLLIDELLSSDLMQVKHGNFGINNDSIWLNFDYATIFSCRSYSDNLSISWHGIEDEFQYSITKPNSPALIEEILSLELPADKISPDWLKLLEKHENDFASEVLFHVDINAKSKRGILQISNIENNKVVKLLKKSK